MSTFRWISAAMVIFMAISLASAPVLEGKGKGKVRWGLAKKYPGDRNLAKNPYVIMVENFERGEIKDLKRRWNDVKNPKKASLRFTKDAPQGSRGRRSLEITATRGKNTGGHLYYKLKKGVDRLYARFYVKFLDPPGYIHHFVHVGGYHPPTNWPQGGAGTRPKGDKRFTVGIEPWGNWGKTRPPGLWHFYAYWHQMRKSGDGKYWGNFLEPPQPQEVPRNRWQCVEVMIKANSAPNRHDGELALWLDGRLVAHFGPGTRRGYWLGYGKNKKFPGLNWRTSNKIKVNFFWLLHYVTPNAARQNKRKNPPQYNRVRFDNIVLATRYIGPIKKRK